MTRNQFTLVKVVMALVVGVVTAYAVITRNNFFLIAVLPIATALLLLARKSVKEIVADERDYETSGRAALMSMKLFAFIAAFFALVLLTQRDINPYYEVIGSTLSFAACFLMLLYSVIFKYYNHFVNSEKKVIYIAVGVIVIIIVSVFGLRLFSGEDSWNCDHGTWVKHGNPSYPSPVIECK